MFRHSGYFAHFLTYTSKKSDLLSPFHGRYGGGGDQGGGGTIEDVVIRGGRIGMRASGSQWTMRSVHITGASDAGLVLAHGGTWAFAFLDLQVSHTPVAVRMERNQATLFVDCSFQEISGPAAIIMDPNSQIYLERVTQTGAAELLSQTGASGVHLAALPATQSFYSGRAFSRGAARPSHGLIPVPSWRRRTPLRPRPAYDDAAVRDVVMW